MKDYIFPVIVILQGLALGVYRYFVDINVGFLFNFLVLMCAFTSIAYGVEKIKSLRTPVAK